jgi:hypothetical protein
MLQRSTQPWDAAQFGGPKPYDQQDRYDDIVIAEDPDNMPKVPKTRHPE